MREADLKDEMTDPTGTAIIRRMRERRRFRFEPGDSIQFDVSGYKLDRELGLAEFIAVQNNLKVFPRWPEVIYE